jgi:site-specific DNA recombinase
MADRSERCPSRSIQAEALDTLVWDAMTRALREPGLLAQEWERRKSQSQAPDDIEAQLKQVDLALKRLKAQEDRLVDAYKNEAIELPKLKEEMGKMKARREQLDRQRQDLERRSRERAEAADAVERLEAFCRRVNQGLEHLTFEEKQKLLRLLIDRIVIEGGKVQIHGIIPLDGHGEVISMRPRYSHWQPAVCGNGADPRRRAKLLQRLL